MHQNLYHIETQHKKQCGTKGEVGDMSTMYGRHEIHTLKKVTGEKKVSNSTRSHTSSSEHLDAL